MIIDFNNEQAVVMPNFKGGEKSLSAKMFFDGKNRILYGVLESGATIGVHTHETNSETIYILSGKGKVLYDGEYEQVSEGMCHHCPLGHTHSLINDSDSDLVFFAVVPEQIVE
ncbi:MAG: cupin domain-containing protein [Ruminococcus sp.]|nr:cupin domain-containing protein [Ruminococcus sp.]